MSGPFWKSTSRGWARARAALVTYFIVFNVIAALPTPRNASPERLARAFEQEELRRWTALLRGAGIDISAGELAQAYVAFAAACIRAREVALRPIEAWMSITRTDQTWRLFGTPDEEAYALSITLHSASGAELLYESGNPERRWSAPLLEYRRIRAGYNPTRTAPPHTFAGIAERSSERIFASRPDAERVSVALSSRRIPLPGKDTSSALGEARPRHVIELSRPAP